MQKLFIKDLDSFFVSARLDMPIILACSGGADSMTLLQSILKLRNIPSLIVAHVDHGWRVESASEALKLKEFVEGKGLQFVLKTLNMKGVKGNLEDACRRLRYQFFKDIYDKYQSQALILGHHYNDQVETVLKRVLEGASLESLKAMKDRSFFMGMNVWRPLLKYKKEELLLELRSSQQWFIQDPTNQDEKYLRARMRNRILPQLNKDFGKRVDSSLFRLSEQAHGFSDFMDDHVKGIEKELISFSTGWMLSDSNNSLHPFALKYFLRKKLRQEGEIFNYSIIQSICRGVESCLSNQWFIGKKGAIYQDRGHIFYFQSLPHWGEEISIEPGETLQFGSWELTFHKTVLESSMDGFRGLLFGQVSCKLPLCQVRLTSYRSKLQSGMKKKIGHLWTGKKVPACFRHILPIALYGKGEFSEFLTTKNFQGLPSEKFGTLTIKYL